MAFVVLPLAFPDEEEEEEDRAHERNEARSLTYEVFLFTTYEVIDVRAFEAPSIEEDE